jgi:hypothetical protein
MEDTPQEILDNKLHDPEAVLTPNQSITLLNHCAELGEQNAAPAAEKTVSIFAGNTGAGKSTTLNALLGCRMKAVRPRELGLSGVNRTVVVVDPESPRKEVLPIGHHGRQSQTFLPKIVPTPNEPNSAYCDCLGFYDTRGAEINIANAINIRKILQQATGVKAVFLTGYNGLFDDRGSSIRALEDMCLQMFGGAENLRKHQNSVLLGITKAPLYEEDGEPLTKNSVREPLMYADSDIATILANRIFFFDPLDRATDNPDFWSLEQCRNAIAQLPVIPQQQATNLFQTTLTPDDTVHLLKTVRRLNPKIVNAITQGDVTALGQHWQLLQRLRVVEHPEVDQLIEGQVLAAINVAILQRADAVKSNANILNFDGARRQLNELTRIVNQLPGVPLACNINEIQSHISACEANKDNKEALDKHLAALNKEIADAHRRLEVAQEQLNKMQQKKKNIFGEP